MLFGVLNKNLSNISTVFPLSNISLYFGILAPPPPTIIIVPLLLRTKFNRYILSISLPFGWTDSLPFCLPTLYHACYLWVHVGRIVSPFCYTFCCYQRFINRYFSPHIAWPGTNLSLHILFSRKDMKGLLCNIFVLPGASYRIFKGVRRCNMYKMFQTSVSALLMTI